MTKVLTLKIGTETTIEVHLLNPGEHFERFGGSSRGLTVTGKNASLITRSLQGGMMTDYEYDIHDPKPWALIARCINGEVKAIAETIN